MKNYQRVRVALLSIAMFLMSITNAVAQEEPSEFERYLQDMSNKNGSFTTNWQKYLSDSASELELLLAFQYAQKTQQDNVLNSSLEAATKRFPKGKMITEEVFNVIRNSDDIDTRKKMYALWSSYVGYADSTRGSGYKDFPKLWIGEGYAAIGNIDSAKYYIDKIYDIRNRRNGYLSVMRAVLNTDKQIPVKGMQFGENFLNTLNKSDSRYPVMRFLYGLCLARNEKYKEAYGYLNADLSNEQIATNLNAYMNDYVKALNSTGHADKSVAVIEQAVAGGYHSSNIKELMRESFLLTGKKEADFETYWKSMNKDTTESIEEELRKDAKNEKAPAFEFTDLAGKLITSKSLLGKVVILDFWATWCGPCTASFPAMQNTVNYYKSDTNVVFLFVNTLEDKNGRTQKVKKFIADKGYSFNVVLDKQIEGTREYVGVNSFNIHGIPEKIFIDPKGVIRFISGGFNGNDNHLVEQIKAAIVKIKQS